MRHAGPLCATSLALALVAPAAAPASTAAPCPGARPSQTTAWRALVTEGAPLRNRPKAAVARRAKAGSGVWLLVLGTARTRGGTCLVEVRLPRRPNTSKAWIASSRVTLSRTRWRIQVSRRLRRVSLLHAGHRVARWTVVVGAPATPTPAGTFAILDDYRPPPGGFYGTWIITLTAHSQVLDDFDGGDGRTGLHGRGAESLLDPLGSARSHGCVRFANAAIGVIVRRIGRERLQGTPVVIH